MEATELRSALRQFTGTTQYYRHLSGLRYTDGVKFLAEAAGAYWLIDLIASWQPKALEDEWLRQFQLWELFVDASGSGTVICSRDSEDEAFRQPVAFTDFPLNYLRLYVEGGVILLPSEH
jgi:hypothetical protein